MSRYTKIRETTGDRVFVAVNHLILTIILALILYPLLFIVSASFSDAKAVTSGRVWLLPVEPTLIGYTAVFSNSQVGSGYLNSLFYVVAGTSVNLVVTFMAAYPLSRRNVIIGKGTIMFVFVFTTLFSGGMIPDYLLLNKMGMVNTRWAMIVPGAMTVWNVIITKTFLETTIPGELFEAAELDGCRDMGTLFRIVLPLSGAIVAVNALFYAVGHWNSFFNAMIYLRNARLFPLQLVLRNILMKNQIEVSMINDIQDLEQREALRTLLKYSLIVVASAPPMAIYPFVQKFFVKGVMIGSVKG